LSPYAVHIDGSGAKRLSVVRVSECGSDETAFAEIQFDFVEKSRSIRDFSFVENLKTENSNFLLENGSPPPP